MRPSRNREPNHKTLVFAGPTLAGLSQWRDKLSASMVFHPPVRCGNVLEAYDEGYRRIVIVDGFFERYAAAWHKEIMHFIVRGGTCVGCSSMGALRAVELAPFGMLGFGKVVEDFRSGAIADDDEVTVAHLDQSKDFVSLTDAMVNIRYTVAAQSARSSRQPARSSAGSSERISTRTGCRRSSFASTYAVTSTPFTTRLLTRPSITASCMTTPINLARSSTHSRNSASVRSWSMNRSMPAG